MSRNVDKANSVLVRYQELQAEETGGFKDFSRYKRPKKVGSVRTLKDALEWRKQAARELADKITKIFDPSLNDFQVEELNDELNELFREKARWDWHITHVLGGVAPRKDNIIGGKVIEGKRYFGRAMVLPHVQELLKKEQESRKKHRNLVNTKSIPRDKGNAYYGTSQANRALQEFEANWTPLLRRHYNRVGGEEHLKPENIPSIKDVESWLVEKRKKKLLEDLQL